MHKYAFLQGGGWYNSFPDFLRPGYRDSAENHYHSPYWGFKAAL